MNLRPLILLLGATYTIAPFTAHAEETTDVSNNTEHLSILGNKQSVNMVPGSAHLLSKTELELFDYSDIMRTLSAIPGVYLLEEDGYGLRPNIGMRGTGQNRSEKVTIMEDGILAAPAPYSAPSAYYFPTSGRMETIEVLKGTSSAMFGPRTTGGVVNMLSRQIPIEPFSGSIKLDTGSDGFAKTNAYMGGQGKQVGALVELFRYQADGFKDINYSDVNTGFVKNDVLAKVKFNTDSTTSLYQEFEIKVKYTDESSNETYMGLTQSDFDESPYSRYSSSQKDNIETEHKQFQINHLLLLSDQFSLKTSAYFNDFQRNWYKVNKIGGKSLGDGGIELAADFDENPNDQTLSIDVKANNRKYLSQGLQTTLIFDLDSHQLSTGIRIHEDEMDRFQWVDTYNLDSDYAMNLESAGIPGTDSNRIDSANATSLFIQDVIELSNFVVSTGLRYENMTIDRRDWGKEDPRRLSRPNLKTNNVEVWLPSVAFTYQLNNKTVLLGGVQKGFSPPAPGNENATNESSINYETGIRYNDDSLSAEAIIFYSDYNNMHGNCTASQGCEDDNLDNQYNAGEVVVSGLEFKAGTELNHNDFRFPLSLTYTYTQTEFMNDFSSKFDTWGEVKIGDELPYVPQNQLHLSFGVAGDNWQSNLIVRYVDKMRTKAGQGSITLDSSIESHMITDFAINFNLSPNQKLSLRIDNLFDQKYIASRVHGSIMAGKPLSSTLAYQYNF